ncbi:hypothetical protein ACHAXA_002394 [Cyclostephanos tholiformis]|uniref:CMP/dCMP-type deaminase domain-containing protein n=1 Tax=Cyclostephanos tholiformis TaxID=382380 RepID=A0ABD3RA65_9STRA
MRDTGTVVPSSARLLLRRLVLLRVVISPRAFSAFAFVHNGGYDGGVGTLHPPSPKRHLYSYHVVDGRRRRARAPSWSLEGSAGIDPPPRPPSTTTTTTTTTIRRPLSSADVSHMRRAIDLARIGYGNTYPNPAVGCVLVRHDDDGNDVVVGSGFHPRAGMPHAEAFALFEACGHVDDGVGAARSVMFVSTSKDDDDDHDHDHDDSSSTAKAVLDLLDRYGRTDDDGPHVLLGGIFANVNVTAYVTLEPCCHVGRTPPCASSLIVSGVRRVVIGCVDPNPMVDGGGIGMLADAGIDVRVLGTRNDDDDDDGNVVVVDGETEAIEDSRILLPIGGGETGGKRNLDEIVDGGMRRALRSIAGRMKADGTMRRIDWPGGGTNAGIAKKSRDDEDDEDEDDDDDASSSGGGDVVDFARDVPIEVGLLESIDGYLWDHELVLLRLNNAVGKKKAARVLSGRVAEMLDAHVAQVIGHTALLYRPSIPPILDLNSNEA